MHVARTGAASVQGRFHWPSLAARFYRRLLPQRSRRRRPPSTPWRRYPAQDGYDNHGQGRLRYPVEPRARVDACVGLRDPSDCRRPSEVHERNCGPSAPPPATTDLPGKTVIHDSLSTRQPPQVSDPSRLTRGSRVRLRRDVGISTALFPRSTSFAGSPLAPKECLGKGAGLCERSNVRPSGREDKAHPPLPWVEVTVDAAWALPRVDSATKKVISCVQLIDSVPAQGTGKESQFLRSTPSRD